MVPPQQRSVEIDRQQPVQHRSTLPFTSSWQGRRLAARMRPVWEDLTPVVSRIASAGRAAWPTVTPRDDVLAALHDADLYLAMALAEGDNAALKVFEAQLVPQIDVALRCHLRRAPSRG